MFELYQIKHGSRGTMAEIWIDRDAKLVRKEYKPNGTTITGGLPYHRDFDEISSIFNNEIYWSTRLKSKYVLEIYEFGELRDQPGYYLLQEYGAPDLLHYYNSETDLSDEIKNPTKQIIEMFSFYKEFGVYKLNNAMCNLTNDNGRIQSFNFKYAVHQNPTDRDAEIYSITTWIRKIDNNLPKLLMDYI